MGSLGARPGRLVGVRAPGRPPGLGRALSRGFSGGGVPPIRRAAGPGPLVAWEGRGLARHHGGAHFLITMRLVMGPDGVEDPFVEATLSTWPHFISYADLGMTDGDWSHSTCCFHDAWTPRASLSATPLHDLRGAIEPAEAVRRGVRRAAPVIVLGDGAVWIWGIVEEHSPGATQIVDLYHAREELAELGKLLYGPGSAEAKRWTAARCEALDAGELHRLLVALGRLWPRGEEAQRAVWKAEGYFATNAARMGYAQFLRRGLFVGSGVVEVGCKTMVGQRLKQSGRNQKV